MIKNACAVLLCSRGTPMFLSGDEFGDTRFGNNNPYCQDNIISWLDWTLLKKNQDLFGFFQYMIQFRKNHPVIRRNLEASLTGFPYASIHGVRPNEPDYSVDSHVICVLYAGYDPADEKEDLVYLAVNTYWEPVTLTLPPLPNGMSWKIAVNTGDLGQNYFSKGNMPDAGNHILMKERSVIVLEA